MQFGGGLGTYAHGKVADTLRSLLLSESGHRVLNAYLNHYSRKTYGVQDDGVCR